MNLLKRLLPWGVLAIALLYLGLVAMPRQPAEQGFNLADFSTLPVVYRGRVQPLDTVARNALMIVSGRQSFVDEDGKYHQAIRWLLDVMVSSTPIREHKVFRIENEEVLALFGLEPRSGFRYSLDEIKPKIEVFIARQKVAKRAEEEKKASLVDAKVLELDQHLKLFIEMASQQSVYTIPANDPATGELKWFTLADLRELMHQNAKAGHEPAAAYQEMLEAFQAKDINDNNVNAKDAAETRLAQLKQNSGEFNRALASYRKWLKENLPSEQRLVGYEAFFNRFEPFYRAIVLYIFVFVLAALSWLARIVVSGEGASVTQGAGVGWPRTLVRAAFSLALCTFVLHTTALVARMYIQGRPPVTNLYSSAIFIGWGCVGLGLFLELVFPYGIGSAVGAVTGGLSLFIAHMLSLNGDTLEMLQAVLDTNFWLATHVTCITLGYTATFMAGFIGILYILAKLFVPDLPREIAQIITRMIYGVLCFATLLSFTGTVLGGIWADQSWGRFWGWDPKENGALLIVLMNALTIHARWGGLVKARGIAVLAVLGNIVVAWSWFGVNMLGVGLHSYGFMHGAVFWLIAFVVSQLFIAGLGLLNPDMVRTVVADIGVRLGFSQHGQEKVETHG